MQICVQTHVQVLYLFFPGIRIFLDLRKPRENGSGFRNERWLERMGNQPLE